MRKVVALIALFCVMLLMSGNVYAKESGFSDMTDSHWAYLYVSEMVNSSVIAGYPDGSFKPANNVSRAEFAKMMAVASKRNLAEVNQGGFSDINNSDWYSDYVYAVADCFNYYNEDGKTLFKPEEDALREDVAVALVKALNIDMSGFDESKIAQMFSDSSDISEDAKKYVGVAVEAGLISGYDDLTFRPKNAVTRAEAATLLYRAFVEYGKVWVWEDVISEWEGGHGYLPDGTYYTITDEEYIYGSKKADTYFSCTPPSSWIEVNPGEVWRVKLASSLQLTTLATETEAAVKTVQLTPVVILDENDNLVWYKSYGSTPAEGFEFTIPPSGAKMYLTYYNNQTYFLQRKTLVNADEVIDESAKKAQVSAMLDANYETYLANQPVLKENDKAYIIFVVDDLRIDVDVYADIFEERGLPLCLAVKDNALMQCASNKTESRKQVAQRVVKNGGEVLSHCGNALTSENWSFDEAYNTFAVSKETLEKEGFEVNGIIMTGGQNTDTIDFTEAEKWSCMFYKYSDRHGVSEPYCHPRLPLYTAYTPIEKFKTYIDNAVENKEMLVFYWHDASNIAYDAIGEYLDYVQSFSSDEIEVVTYKTYYDRVCWGDE